MTAINFEARFAPLVEEGIKRQTIRTWNRAIHKGRALQLYTGMRTKRCRKLADAICTSIVPITVTDAEICIDGGWISFEARHDFARADGFNGIGDFISYWEAGRDESPFPIEGWLIKWSLDPASTTGVFARQMAGLGAPR